MLLVVRKVSLLFLPAFPEHALLCALSGLNSGIGLNYDIYRFDKIDSTNSYLLRLGEEGFPEGTVAVADEQVEGRGRFGRRWEAEPLSSLLFSVLLRPGFLQRDEVFILTFAAAVAVAQALELVANARPELKWPNDVLLEGKKVCGILLESSFEGGELEFIVLGVGLNVNQSEFPLELRERATSLFLETQREFEREELLKNILMKFNSIYEILKTRDFYKVMKSWRNRATTIGKRIELKIGDRIVEGILEQVTDDGAVVLDTPSGPQRFTAGEISVSRTLSPGGGEKQ